MGILRRDTHYLNADVDRAFGNRDQIPPPQLESVAEMHGKELIYAAPLQVVSYHGPYTAVGIDLLYGLKNRSLLCYILFILFILFILCF